MPNSLNNAQMFFGVLKWLKDYIKRTVGKKKKINKKESERNRREIVYLEKKKDGRI